MYVRSMYIHVHICTDVCVEARDQYWMSSCNSELIDSAGLAHPELGLQVCSAALGVYGAA